MAGERSLPTMRLSALAAVVALVSCSSSGSSDPTIELQPADSIRANEATTGTSATFGQPIGIGELTVTASDPVADVDESGPWLTLNVRAENPTTDEQPPPFFELHCSGNPDGGGWLDVSTYEQQKPLPAGSFDEGTVSLLLPGDGRYGEPRPACATPATVIAKLVRFDDNGAPADLRVVWPVPDDVVATLNAAPQPS